MRIVGYEGKKNNAVCNWGAAAVMKGGKLINAVSTFGSNDGETKLLKYIKQGVIEKLEVDIEIDREDIPPMFIFDMPASVFDREPYSPASIGSWRNVIASACGKTRAYHVFVSHKALQSWLYHIHAGKFILVPYAV